MSKKELDQFIEDYGYLASTTYTVPVCRDRLKHLVLSYQRLLDKFRDKTKGL